jgi:cytoskeletal protein RodZ
VRLWVRASFVALLAIVGFLSAVLLAGCGGGGTAASGTRSATLADRTTTTSSGTVEASPTLPAQTRVAATVTETQSVTETRPVITATTTTLTETNPSLTVNTSTTVVTVAPPTTTTAETGKDTPGWVWVVILLFAGTVIGLIVALIRRHPSELPLAQRRRILDGAVASWTGGGWMIESQSDESAVLVRDGERTVIAVDGAGHVTSGRVPPSSPS